MATIDMKDNDHEVGPNGLEPKLSTIPGPKAKISTANSLAVANALTGMSWRVYPNRPHAKPSSSAGQRVHETFIL
jgi:hypothetical protein